MVIKSGELTHTDVWGPARNPMAMGACFFMTFIDDYTWRSVIKFLKTKGEVAEKVKDYIAWMERQTTYMPRHFRLDNRKEYLSNELISWCQSKGIVMELTAPHSPQQNKIAERYNRTLLDLTCAMLKAKNLPKVLWATAVDNAAYVQNRAYT
jgi:transposase InsO family protein